MSSTSFSPSARNQNRPLHVLKFGGTSVGRAARLRQAVEIVRSTAEKKRVVVVVSAAAGVTDLLAQAAATVHEGRRSVAGWIEHLERRHDALGEKVFESAAARARYGVFLRVFLGDLRAVLEEVTARGDTPPLRDRVLAVGERLMAPLFALALGETRLRSSFVDSSRLIRTDETYGEAAVHRAATFREIRKWHRAVRPSAVPVVTGFIGRAENGAMTTLGRGGSDYSAALIAAGLRADLLERWTDVEGLYTDDPRRNPEAERLERIVLEEAAAWNRAGRLGMHRKMLEPLVEAGIPVRIRCTLRPEVPGTLILPAHRKSVAKVCAPA